MSKNTLEMLLPYHPCKICKVYLPTFGWFFFMVNVGKYIKYTIHGLFGFFKHDGDKISRIYSRWLADRLQPQKGQNDLSTEERWPGPKKDEVVQSYMTHRNSLILDGMSSNIIKNLQTWETCRCISKIGDVLSIIYYVGRKKKRRVVSLRCFLVCAKSVASQHLHQIMIIKPLEEWPVQHLPFDMLFQSLVFPKIDIS